ncbi:MAG TPA: GNAT family N-acetyltransferase [Methanoregulaceae archaeon]|nr:GNAT family N-acetyltransferase [Methanoregulaceae archaeon]
MEITLKLASENDAQIWDKIVTSSPQGSIFHTWKWLHLVEKHTDTRLYPIMGLKGEAIIGILPVFHMKKYGMSAAFSPPPSTDIPYLGPVLKDSEGYPQYKKESIEKEFQSSVDHYLTSDLGCGFIALTLSTHHDPRPYMWADYILEPIFDYHLNLNQDIEAIWQKMNNKLRAVIKRTEKQGVIIEDGSEADLIDIYNSVFRRYKEQNRSLTLSQDYLVDLYRAFYPENFKVFVAKENGETIGGIIAISYNNRILSWVGKAKPESSNISPNDLAQWEIIRYANSKGYSLYEEIGAGTERLSRFKAKFNPKPVCRFYVRKYPSRSYRILEKAYSTTVKRVIGKLV